MIEACRHAAIKAGLDPALVCAVIAVESGGNPVEAADGVTPTVLPEPHEFWKELRRRAMALGIASEEPLERPN